MWFGNAARLYPDDRMTKTLEDSLVKHLTLQTYLISPDKAIERLSHAPSEGPCGTLFWKKI